MPSFSQPLKTGFAAAGARALVTAPTPIHALPSAARDPAPAPAAGPPLPLLGPRALPLDLLRVPLNAPIPILAESHSLACLDEAAGHLVQPGLVLAPDAGHGHASPAAGGARRSKFSCISIYASI
jgi:hypothetical protein